MILYHLIPTTVLWFKHHTNETMLTWRVNNSFLGHRAGRLQSRNSAQVCVIWNHILLPANHVDKAADHLYNYVVCFPSSMKFRFPSGSCLCLHSLGIPYIFLHMGGTKQKLIKLVEQSAYLECGSKKISRWIMEFSHAFNLYYSSSIHTFISSGKKTFQKDFWSHGIWGLLLWLLSCGAFWWMFSGASPLGRIFSVNWLSFISMLENCGVLLTLHLLGVWLLSGPARASS